MSTIRVIPKSSSLSSTSMTLTTTTTTTDTTTTTTSSTDNATLVGAPPSFSVDKLAAFETFRARATSWRILRALLWLPIAGLGIMLLPTFIPLADPRAGIAANAPGFAVHGFVATTMICLGVMLHTKAGAEMPHETLSIAECARIALVTSLLHVPCMLVLAFAWRFPVPMSWILGAQIVVLALAAAHGLVLGRRLHRDPTLLPAILRYLPALIVQSAQVALYPAFSVLFDHGTTAHQILQALTFPVLKLALMRLCRRYTRHLGDFSIEVGVSGVEISASLYQSMVLQSSRSRIAIAVVMGVDVLLGLVAVKILLDRRPRRQLLSSVLQKLTPRRRRSTFPDLDQAPTVARAPSAKAPELAPPERTPSSAARKLTATTIMEATAVDETRRLLAAAEGILLVEYFEVAIPVLHACYLGISCQLGSARYNTKLWGLYEHPPALQSAILSVLLYAGLQGLSLVAIDVVLRWRFGLSGVHQLAFTLEYHALSIFGKMLAWLPFMSLFTVIHYGTDFSFRFDFQAILATRPDGT